MENTKKEIFPEQHQNRHPGKESEMTPAPIFDNKKYKAAGKLDGKVAVISGGDSGIGRAVAIAFAKEGADVAIIHLRENDDAMETEKSVREYKKKCLVIAADLRTEQTSADIAGKIAAEYNKIDILVNNAGVQYPQNSILEISGDQMKHTFESNFFSCFYLTKAVLPHMQKGGSIINTTSVTAFEGHETLIDYSATKGAIVSFTRSMALSLVKQEIRVNAVAPGPVWTPLIVSSFSAEEVKTFGSTTPMARAAQPCELAPAYVFLASDDSNYMTGQALHINGGKIIN